MNEFIYTSYINKVITMKDKIIFNTLFNILKYKSHWYNKLKKIKEFKISRSRSLSLNIQVRFSGDKWYHAGTINKQLRPNTKKQLTYALRQAINYQIQRWSKSNNECRLCVHCNTSSSLQVDHKQPSFAFISKSFLRQVQLRPPNVFSYHKYGCKFRVQDRKFRRIWSKYHEKIATYQWLCKRCNLKKGTK